MNSPLLRVGIDGQEGHPSKRHFHDIPDYRLKTIDSPGRIFDTSDPDALDMIPQRPAQGNTQGFISNEERNEQHDPQPVGNVFEPVHNAGEYEHKNNDEYEVE